MLTNTEIINGATDSCHNAGENTNEKVPAPESVEVLENANNIAEPMKEVGDAVDKENNAESDLERVALPVILSNTLKIMDGKYGGGFYIKFIQDERTGYGWLYLIIVYPDGTYKSLILYKNALIETNTDGNNGVHTVKKEQRGYHSQWDRPELDDYNSLKQYETPQMPIPVKALWARILDNYEKIPISKIQQSGTWEDIYEALFQAALDQSTQYGQGFMMTNECFWVESEVFGDIITRFGRDVSRVRTELNMLGLFIKDNGSKGYQKSKRIKDEHKHFYVLRKVTGLQITTPAHLDDTTFETGGKTKAEITIENLNKRVADLAKKYNEKAEEFGFDCEL